MSLIGDPRRNGAVLILARLRAEPIGLHHPVGSAGLALPSGMPYPGRGLRIRAWRMAGAAPLELVVELAPAVAPFAELSTHGLIGGQ